jgi:phage shock protein C
MGNIVQIWIELTDREKKEKKISAAGRDYFRKIFMDNGRKLVRPRQGRMIAGVAAAFANYFNVDVTVVRLIWVLLALPGGIPGIILYIICWALIPQNGEERSPMTSKT